MKHKSIINPEFEAAVDKMVQERKAADERRKRKTVPETEDESILDIEVEE